MYEGTVWATRLWKRGKKKEETFEGVCEGTGQATRLRKSGKKRGRVRVLGWWATRF